MNWSTTTAHELAHSTATYKYKDKLLFTANARDIDKENAKYTISFNKDKSRAWHFFSSKDIFFKWETANDGSHGVDLEIKGPDGKWTDKAIYTPIEVKDK